MIKLMKNTFYHEAETKKDLCDFIMGADRLSMGEKCKEFEEAFSAYHGRRYSVLYNSGSSANLALIQSLVNLGTLKKGDNIGVSALTWATNVMPLIQMGLNPLPIDVSLETLNITSEKLAARDYNLKALFLTNVLGFSGDLPQIKKECDERKIILLEDNCESLGSIIGGRRLGNYGIANTSSFFVGHHLSTIEGGMVSTDDTELYKMLVMVRAHGWGRNLDSVTRKNLQTINNIDDFNEPYTFYYPGYNLRPTEITGFLGLSQLKYLNEMNNKRFNNFLKFQNAAMRNPDIRKLRITHMDFVSNFAFPLIFKDRETAEEYKKKFSGLEIRTIVSGSLTEQPFFKREKLSSLKCPNAEIAQEMGFYIPNNPDLTSQEVDTIVNLIKNETRL